MNDLPIKTKADVDAFLGTLKTVQSTADAGRLLLCLDATASREPTWDLSSQLQTQMFVAAQKSGTLNVQLVYFRGYQQCRASRWTTDPNDLIRWMQNVRCQAGQTQIARLLRHACQLPAAQSASALVFVGDAVEEDPDTLYTLAGNCRLKGTRLFFLQEGTHPATGRCMRKLAQLSGGAHLPFAAGSREALLALLQAVASYSTGGMNALRKMAAQDHSAAKLLEQMP